MDYIYITYLGSAVGVHRTMVIPSISRDRTPITMGILSPGIAGTTLPSRS